MPIRYLDEQRLFLLETDRTAYVIYLAEHGQLLHLYWGEKLVFPADYPGPPLNHAHSAFNTWGNDMAAEFPVPYNVQEIETCLRLRFADGTRDLRLKYSEHIIDGDNLAITLKDEFYGFTLRLVYRVYPECDILTRRAEIINSGQEIIRLDEVLSGSVPLPYDRGDFRLSHLSGTHVTEFQLDREPVKPGRKVLEGRQNYTGHAHNPFFALDLVDSQGGATETGGEVWFGGLQWSGNWKIVVEQTRSPLKRTRVAAGINDWDFEWQLWPGQTFETPWMTLGYTSAGFGQVTRNLHRYQLAHILPQDKAADLRPVLYNSWEAVLFNVNETTQMALAEKAARCGVELFVVDDGWFGAREHDRAGLGDWTVNPQRFPRGLQPLIDHVNRLGMQFGLWVEPEMVNPDSDLYRAHPDWAYHYPNRVPTEARNQLILNLGRLDVQEYLFGVLDGILSKYNIDYIKWDYNRAISEAGGAQIPAGNQREHWVRHYQGLYRLVDRLRERHPQVIFENCSGGGGRVDMGMLSHFDQSWTSDNTDPLDRLAIQQGYSLVYPVKTMFCWVTDMNQNAAPYSLRYRFLSSFMGGLGIGSNLNHFSDGQIQEAAYWVAEYKRLRPVIQHGELYRLLPLNAETEQQDSFAVGYVAPDKSQAVVIALDRRSHHWRNPRRLRLPGLDPAAHYRLAGDVADREPQVLSGQAIQARGILPKLEGELAAALITLTRES
ncbi:MAG: Alpha-galactosidase [Chloroflexi bacterium]|jgi:alpha-galactosidase|nr:Alpha-galactosidase [Chloroflexota bacterium]